MHPETLSSYGVAASTLQRCALAKSGYAWSNGRRCVVRPDVLASIMGVSERQAQRCNALARALGLEVVVMQGRMLTQEERWRAYDAGSRQRGLATETALTIPPDQRGLVDHVTPPRGGSVTTETKDLLGFPHGLPAGINGAATRPRPQSRRRKGSPAWRLALDVVRAVPWLAQESPHRLVGVLARYVDVPYPLVRCSHRRSAHRTRPSTPATLDDRHSYHYPARCCPRSRAPRRRPNP